MSSLFHRGVGSKFDEIVHSLMMFDNYMSHFFQSSVIRVWQAIQISANQPRLLGAHPALPHIMYKWKVLVHCNTVMFRFV